MRNLYAFLMVVPTRMKAVDSVYLSGIADEAAEAAAGQIQAHQSLGWRAINCPAARAIQWRLGVKAIAVCSTILRRRSPVARGGKLLHRSKPFTPPLKPVVPW